VQSNPLDATTQAPADFSCLHTRMDPAAPTTATTLPIVVADFQTKMPVAGATVEVYTSLDHFNASTPDGTSAVTDAGGNTMLTVPAGSYRVIFRTVGDASTVETIEFNRAYNDGKRYSVAQTTKQVIQAVLSIIPDDTLGVIAGSQRDCQERETGGVLFSSAPVSGAAFDNSKLTFYFVDASATNTVPTKAQKYTSGDGVFASLNLPPGDVDVTSTGVLQTGMPAVTLGRGRAPVRAGSITVVQIEPLSGP
jgi:hypothetical protein